MAAERQATTDDERRTTFESALHVRPSGLWTDAWRRLSRNRAAKVSLLYILLVCLVAIFAPLIAPDSPNDTSATATTFAVPFWKAGHDPQHILGTDELARDELSRLIYGARVSMAVGLIPTAIITVVGTLVGLVAGWAGGWLDDLLMRLVDAVYAFPAFLFFIVLATVLRDTRFGHLLGGLVLLFTAFAIVGWTDMARLVRGQVLSVKQHEYVEAARALGAPNRRIVFRHILPNSLAPIIVAIAFSIPAYILAEASLSFLGLGVQASVPSWGQMVFDSFPAILSKSEFVLMPSLLIASVMLAFTFLGDGLRDALDPKMTM
ncbi:MAG TPA: ABC transporter permease [Thermomicrobiaceae bacterium]|nr:ABC transporter permease [Thermomicrobiaceae bacterium]